MTAARNTPATNSTNNCQNRTIRRSMGRTGICWDNAVAESFFATYKKELIHTPGRGRRSTSWKPRRFPGSKPTTIAHAGIRRSTTWHRWNTS